MAGRFWAVSYTHLDVYKRQGLCHHIVIRRSQYHIAVTMGAEKQCCRTNNSEVQECRSDLNDEKKTEDRSVTTVGNVVIYRPVSYTHLDVYKRQMDGDDWNNALKPAMTP